jgi:large subunit ribosomal protein L5
MAENKQKKTKKNKKAPAENLISKDYRSRLVADYRERIVPELMKEFSYKNVMQVPKLVKIVLNMGIGEANRDAKILDTLVGNMDTIAGQKSVVTKAKKSIANFKIREGMDVGCMVTLRNQRMFDFIDRFINICVPRMRDFRGLSPKSFDGRGNYAIGIQEQLIFPEISFDDVVRTQGMDIVFVTSAPTDEEGRKLLKMFGMPFRS